MHLYAYLALDLANERALEAGRHRLARLAHGDQDQPGRARRLAARALAWLSRSSAIVARRLDECIADELVDPFRAERLPVTR